MSEFGGFWKHENNQHALVPPKTDCGCLSGGGIKNGHIRYGGTQKKKNHSSMQELTHLPTSQSFKQAPTHPPTIHANKDPLTYQLESPNQSTQFSGLKHERFLLGRPRQNSANGRHIYCLYQSDNRQTNIYVEYRYKKAS